MNGFMRWLVDLFRPIPKCPACGLMLVEARLTNCRCEFGTDATRAPDGDDLYSDGWCINCKDHNGKPACVPGCPRFSH